jgi:hypothetical protein
MTRMEAQRAERQRIRELIHDYCFTEQCGKGCAGCPVSAAKACDVGKNGAEPSLPRLREAEQIILKERGATS